MSAAGSVAPARPSDRWPALDGLRGWMTVGVFVAHVHYPWLPGSVLFMDTFFMMSSFFITRLLIKDWRRHGRLNFKAFYVRRVRRLFPALLLMVAAVTVFSVFYQRHSLRQLLNVAGAILYFTNWLRALEIPHEALLGHTWSLSIEEQYYLFWPLLLGLGLRWQAHSTVAASPDKANSAKLFHIASAGGVCLLAGIVMFTFGWRAYLAMSGASIERLYNGTDMRLDSLALGALLALVLDAPRVQRWCEALAKPWLVWVLLLLFLGGGLTVSYFDMQWYTWQQSLFSCLSLVLLMSFIKDPNGYGLRWALQNPVSLYLGSICYGVYLWHSPLIEIGRNLFGLGIWANFAVCAPLTLALAALSHHFIELPALKGKVGSAR